MAKRLHKDGHPVYPLPLGTNTGCIERKARLLSRFLDEHRLRDGRSIAADEHGAAYESYASVAVEHNRCQSRALMMPLS
jgi:hypothetical protein